MGPKVIGENGVRASAVQVTLEEVFDLAYAEIHALAASYMRHERREHTLTPTALVHEAYLRLARSGLDSRLGDHLLFRAAAARSMRQILVDHARTKSAAKRGGGWRRIAIDVDIPSRNGRTEVDLLEIDDALQQLEAESSRCAHVVELRCFGGLTVPEVATYLGVSPRTVDVDWRFGLARLAMTLRGASRGESRQRD